MKNSKCVRVIMAAVPVASLLFASVSKGKTLTAIFQAQFSQTGQHWYDCTQQLPLSDYVQAEALAYTSTTGHYACTVVNASAGTSQSVTAGCDGNGQPGTEGIKHQVRLNSGDGVNVSFSRTPFATGNVTSGWNSDANSNPPVNVSTASGSLRASPTSSASQCINGVGFTAYSTGAP